MVIFKRIINYLFKICLFAGIVIVWLIPELELIEKILFTILFVALIFLRKIYSMFKEFVINENNRIRLFTDHILNEYEEVQEESSVENDSTNEPSIQENTINDDF